jgi:galactose mutarotase-like enzyme
MYLGAGMAITQISNDDLTVEVSSLGSEMQSVVTSDGQSWLWHGDGTFWAGRSPILFPIVGRAPGDHISVDGERHPIAQHGFARRSEFELMENGGDFCRFRLIAGPTSLMIYPFDFELVLEHRLEGRSVTVTAEVTNRDSRPMPFGIGFHPAFLWPMPGADGQPHQVVLDNGGEPVRATLSGGLIEREMQPSPFEEGVLVLDHALFADDALVFPEGAGAGLRYQAGDKAIRMTWQNLPNLALWTKGEAPFICLEPWHGMAAVAGGSDAIEERPYGEVLGPGASGRYSFRVEFVG